MNLTREMQMDVLLQLQPRHVYKLMQTNKTLYFLCRSEAYWSRVAAYLTFGRNPYYDRIETALLRGSYRTTVDEYIKYLRSEIRGNPPPYCDNADLPLTQLALVGEGDYLAPLGTYVPSTNSFRIAKRVVEDVAWVGGDIQAATQAMVVPRQNGFISRFRRAERVAQTFLRSLEDDRGMDLNTKKRVREYANLLLRSISAKRGQHVRDPVSNRVVSFELHEANIDARDVRYSVRDISVPDERV